MTDRVSVDLQESVAATAANLARDLWIQTHDKSPKIENRTEFLALVADCARALRGVKP